VRKGGGPGVDEARTPLTRIRTSIARETHIRFSALHPSPTYICHRVTGRSSIPLSAFPVRPNDIAQEPRPSHRFPVRDGNPGEI